MAVQMNHIKLIKYIVYVIITTKSDVTCFLNLSLEYKIIFMLIYFRFNFNIIVLIHFQVSHTPETSESKVPSHIVNIRRRYRRDEPNPCFKFEEGDPIKNEFYSPGYPEAYPKNISCYKVLEGEHLKVVI